MATYFKDPSILHLLGFFFFEGLLILPDFFCTNVLNAISDLHNPIKTLFYNNSDLSSLLLKLLRRLKEIAYRIHNQASVQLCSILAKQETTPLGSSIANQFLCIIYSKNFWLASIRLLLSYTVPSISEAKELKNILASSILQNCVQN